MTKSTRQPIPMKVLFLCTGNSCRSQMAEGLWRTIGGPEALGYSAGLSPVGVHPIAIVVMAEVGIDIRKQESKGLSEVPLDQIEAVITLCDHAERHCPTFPGSIQKYHLPIKDPVRFVGSQEEVLGVFRATRDEIKLKLSEWFQSFKVGSLE